VGGEVGEVAGLEGGHAAADAEDVAHVADVAGDEVEAGVGVVAPADGDLFKAGAHAEGEGDDFHIVHIAVNLGVGEDGFGEAVAEELEAALGIADAGESDEELHHIIEAAAAEAAVEGLGLFDFRFAAGAGADDEIGVGAEEREELVELFDGHLVVGVGEADDVTGGLFDAEADAAAFAGALGGAEHDNSGNFGGEFAGFFAGAVVTVGRDDDLRGQATGGEVGMGFPDSVNDRFRLVIRR
jgi:hypothetical protein